MNRVQRGISIIVPIIVIALVMYFFSDLVAYALIAWVVSLIASPIKAFLLELKLGGKSITNTLATILTLVTVISIFASVIGLFVPKIINQVNVLGEVSQEEWLAKIEHPVQLIGQWLEDRRLIDDADNIQGMIAAELSTRFNPDSIGNFLSELVGLTGGFIIGLFSVLFISFFFIRDDQLFLRALQTVVPNDKEAAITKILKNTSYLLSRYFTGVVTQVFVITLLVFLGLTLVGIKNALLIAFFAAVINLIPYIGPMLGAAFALFMVITSNIHLPFSPDLVNLLWPVVIVFGIMQLIDNFFIQPFVFSKSVKAHPLEIFFVVLIGAQLGGVVGMILAIPTYTVLRVIASVLLSESQVVQKVTKGLNTFVEEEG